jgi:hypothetical protein
VESLTAHVGVPLSALVVVWLIEFELNTPIMQQAARLGTHLCILAIGATGAVLTSPKLLKGLDPQGTVLISIMAVLAEVALAAIAIKVHRSNMADWWKAVTSVFLGLFAVATVSGIVVWGEQLPALSVPVVPACAAVILASPK